MHILVTGATGFVGAALVRRLLAAGHRVTALVRPGGDPGLAEGFAHLLGSGTPRLPDGVEAVVHLAQSRAYRRFPEDAREMFQVNVAGTQELLEAAVAAGVSAFCLVSSGTVYEPFATPMTEDAPLAPASLLGATKLAAEVLARPFAGAFALPVLRLFAPYGPGQTNRLVPDLIHRVQSGGAVTLPERGDGMRFTPTHVDDVCDLIAQATIEGWRDVLNVAAAGSVSIAEAAGVIGEVLGRVANIERRSLGAPVVVPDLTRLAARYPLSRFRNFETGIRDTLAAERG